jgi:hypothetical protein
MVMTPLQRKAAFRAAATLQEISMNDAARKLRVSYNHLMLVLYGPEGHAEGRRGSAVLQKRIAQFIGRPVHEVFSTPGDAPGPEAAAPVLDSPALPAESPGIQGLSGEDRG